MDRDRGAVLQVGGSAQPVGATALAEPPIMILPGRSTPLLRRCTALATRARVDLLVTTRPADCAELSEVLAELAAWEGGQLIDHDLCCTGRPAQRALLNGRVMVATKPLAGVGEGHSRACVRARVSTSQRRPPVRVAELVDALA